MMNNLENIENGNFDPKPNSLNYGIVITHAWIRVFEFMINLSIKLPFKCWRRKGTTMKNDMIKREEDLKKKLFDQFGIRINEPRDGGKGNSNCGNTSRRAFAHPLEFGSILEIDFDFVKHLQSILILLSCQFPIDLMKFKNLCLMTAKLHVDNYEWYKMPATVHTILIHATQIMQHSLLPVGMLGEEGLESSNKVNKSNRQHHSRQNSRLNTMYDMFYRRIDGSDPLMSSMQISKQSKPKRNTFSEEVLNIILMPETSDYDLSEDQSLRHIYEDLDATELLNEICDEESDEEQLF